MKIAEDSPPVLSALDRPNSYIGRSVPRPNLDRLAQGRAQYVSDVTLPRMAHAAFVRSPHAHARIVAIDTAAAKNAPGVIAVVTGAELAKVITPWVGVLTHLKGIKSAPQHAIAVDRACWAGEAVCAVVARTRAEAEDACELIDVSYENCRPSPNRKPRSIPARWCCTPSSATISASSACTRPAIPTRASRTPTLSSKRRSCSAATPASATSRDPSSPTGIPASNASPSTRARRRRT